MGNQVKPENTWNKNGDTRGMHPNSRKNLGTNANPNAGMRKTSLADILTISSVR